MPEKAIPIFFGLDIPDVHARQSFCVAHLVLSGVVLGDIYHFLSVGTERRAIRRKFAIQGDLFLQGMDVHGFSYSCLVALRDRLVPSHDQIQS